MQSYINIRQNHTKVTLSFLLIWLEWNGLEFESSGRESSGVVAGFSLSLSFSVVVVCKHSGEGQSVHVASL
jgi:hypothetical protein